MSDLIERQAAVDAVNDLAKWYCETYHETRPTVMAVIDMLERLPSEQLEKTQLSEEDTTSDCISRQAAIGILYNFAGCIVDTPNGDYHRAYKASRHELETLPSAQPNLQQTCNQLATDCISRQAAIDVAKAHWYKPDIVGAVEQLPSVQIDLTHIVFETLAECGIYGEEATVKFIGTLKRLGRSDLLPPCAR